MDFWADLDQNHFKAKIWCSPSGGGVCGAGGAVFLEPVFGECHV